MPDNQTEQTPRRLRIGKIVGCHGLRGYLKLRPASDKADWFDALEEVFLESPDGKTRQTLTIESARWQGNNVLLRFEGYPDRTATEALVGSIVYANAETLPVPETDEYWVDDLIGLTVLDAHTGHPYGVVHDLLSSTGSDFLEIRLDNVTDTVVVPFIHRFFPTVDLAARTIAVDLPEGFLPDAIPIPPDKGD